MTTPRGFRIAMIILALAWGINFLALAFNGARVPGALADPYAIWELVATSIAAIGAIVARGFHMIGVVLYGASSLSLAIKAYLPSADTLAPAQVGWLYILALVIFASLVWSEWERFRRPNA